MEGKEAAEKDGFQSPVLAVVGDRPELEPGEAETLSMMGVIFLEDTPDTHDLLASLREEIDAGTTQPAPEVQKRQIEHWRMDDQGYLVLSDVPESRPVIEPTPAHVYQALLDALNAFSERRG